MGLIGASDLMLLAQSYRLVWISGRFGGGKTVLAYRIAYDFLRHGYRLVSNNRCVWADDPEDVKLDANGQLHCVVVLDEGGLWFKASRQIEMIASYAAKMDVVYLLPSFWPPTRAAQVVTVQPMYGFHTAGIPLTVYRWGVRMGGFREGGHFGWWRPSEVYGFYSRQDPGDTGSAIVDWLIRRTDEFRKHHGRTDNLSNLEGVGGEVDRLGDAAAEMVEAAESFAAFSVGKRNRRRL